MTQLVLYDPSKTPCHLTKGTGASEAGLILQRSFGYQGNWIPLVIRSAWVALCRVWLDGAAFWIYMTLF